MPKKTAQRSKNASKTRAASPSARRAAPARRPAPAPAPAARKSKPKARAASASSADVRLALLARASDVGVWEVHLAHGALDDPRTQWWCSGEFKALIGLAPEATLSSPLGEWAARLRPADRQAFLAGYAAHLADRSGNTPLDVEHEAVTRDVLDFVEDPVGFVERGPLPLG